MFVVQGTSLHTPIHIETVPSGYYTCYLYGYARPQTTESAHRLRFMLPDCIFYQLCSLLSRLVISKQIGNCWSAGTLYAANRLPHDEIAGGRHCRRV
eukprot:6192637-Pleurochrysis_carterae.AAC.1